MRQIPTYIVPPEVWKSEEEHEPLALDFSIGMSRKKQYDYLKSFKTMIHLEEAAQTIFLKTFNQTKVRIFYTGTGRLFFFLNEVSGPTIDRFEFACICIVSLIVSIYTHFNCL